MFGEVLDGTKVVRTLWNTNALTLLIKRSPRAMKMQERVVSNESKQTRKIKL